jgi:hypothetical protein
MIMAVARHTEPDDEETLDELVARIKERGRGSILPRPADEAIRAFLERTANDVPLSPEDVEAWDRAWSGVMQEMRDRDLADAVAEGRVTRG